MPEVYYLRSIFSLVVGLVGVFSGYSQWTQTSGPEGIFFPDSAHGTTVGSRGLIATSSDGGITWTRRTSPTSTIFFRAVAYVPGNPQFGTVVGDSGTVVRTTDAGLTWTMDNSGVNESLASVWMINATEAVMVGSFGTVFRRQ